MKIDNFDLVRKLLDLPWYNLILISLLIIPVFPGAWITFLNALRVRLTNPQKQRLVLVFIGIYVIGLTIGKIGYENENNTNLAKIKEAVLLDLKSNGGILGFKRIRERRHFLTEDMLYKIADLYPKDFEVTPIADPSDPTKIRRDVTDPFGLKLR